MRYFNATEKRAFELMAEPRKPKGVKVWGVYYANGKNPLYESENYAFCRAEINRLMINGIGFRKDLFKIK